MANQAAPSQGHLRAQRIKVGVCIGVVALCLGWLGFVFLGERPTTDIAPATPCQALMALTGKLYDEPRFEYVQFAASQDGKTMTISGKVPAPADLDDLKKLVAEMTAKLASEGRPVELSWSVAPKK